MVPPCRRSDGLPFHRSPSRFHRIMKKLRAPLPEQASGSCEKTYSTFLRLRLQVHVPSFLSNFLLSVYNAQTGLSMVSVLVPASLHTVGMYSGLELAPRYRSDESLSSPRTRKSTISLLCLLHYQIFLEHMQLVKYGMYVHKIAECREVHELH